MDNIHKKLYHIHMLNWLGVDSRPGKILALSALLALLFLWVFSVWRWRLSPDFIPLHYTVYFGFDRFGPKSDIFLFSTLGTVILGLNWPISRILFRHNALWQGLLWAATLVLELTLLLSLMLVVFKTL